MNTVTPGTNHRLASRVVIEVKDGVVPPHLVEPPDPKTEAFCLWRAAVSRLVQRTFGVALADLPDMATRDAFDAGVSPESFFAEDVVRLMREEYGSEMVDAMLGGQTARG